MIEQVCNIGRVIREIDGDKSLVELWTKDTKPIDNIIVIDINDKTKKITKEVLDFYEDVYKDCLIYQQGNGHVGAGIKIENYKKEDANKIKNKKVMSSLSFMELDESYLDEVWNIIENEINKDIKQSYLIMINKNGKKPIELYESKYNKKIKETYLISDKNLQKKIKKSTCHLCGKLSKVYDTAIYKCFTNDKEIYSNTDAYTFTLCEDCLNSILHGRSYINENLKVNWIGSEVMFLPHEFSEDIKDLYETTIDKDNKITGLLRNLKELEGEVLEEIGKTNCITDIVFFSDPKASSEWKITYAIRGVLPTRFGKLGSLIEKYKLVDQYFSIYKIMSYLCYSDGKFESKNKDRMRLLDILFKGTNFSRSMFFNKVMDKYKKEYFKTNNNSHFVLKDIHEIYNFMCECSCLENPWKLINEEGELMEYKNREEFFEVNKEFFDNDLKKAWFIMGQVYSNTIYQSKRYKSVDDKNINQESSHLERNFFFSRKFDYTTFIHFANQCSEKLTKYGTYYNYIREDLNKAKEYMGTGKIKINNDEAKYIFFWGMDMKFKKDEELKNLDKEVNEEVTR